MRNKLFTAKVLSSATLAGLILGGLAPAVSAQSPMPEPDQLVFIPPVTIPEPDPDPDPKPALPLGPFVLVTPTIPEEPPFPPDDDDDHPTFNPGFELCLDLETLCKDLDDLITPPGDDGEDPEDPGDEPGADEPAEEPTDDPDPEDVPTEEEPTEEPTDDGSGDESTDDDSDSDVDIDIDIDIDIDAPVTGSPTFTG